jgi:hypothetical protein
MASFPRPHKSAHCLSCFALSIREENHTQILSFRRSKEKSVAHEETTRSKTSHFHAPVPGGVIQSESCAELLFSAVNPRQKLGQFMALARSSEHHTAFEKKEDDEEDKEGGAVETHVRC